MKRQSIRTIFVVLLLGASAYATADMLATYVSAITGQLSGAGAAQWQFEFIYAPAPALLGLVAGAVVRWPRPTLPRPFMLVSIAAILVPLVLMGLVLSHAY